MGYNIMQITTLVGNVGAGLYQGSHQATKIKFPDISLTFQAGL